jgi:hypothetical protein
MRIRLEIIAAGSTRVVELPGPAVRLGRDPRSEVPIEGPTSDAVSWQHARIDLTPTGAYLSDLKSTNGTRLNERRLAETMALQPGDYIQLGQSGPVLKLLELDLSPAPAPPAREPPRESAAPVAPSLPPAPREVPSSESLPLRPRERSSPARGTRQPQLILMGSIAAGLILILVVVTILVLRSRPEDTSLANQPDDSAMAKLAGVKVDPPVQPAKEPLPRSPEPAPGQTPAVVPQREATPPREASPPRLPPARKASAPADANLEDTPSTDRRPIGRYAPERNGPPSVLLWRADAEAPWARLRSNERVATAGHLVSLPGDRSPVLLDCKVQLGLWGNVPEFSNFPAVLESSVMLNVPASGTDLDFILDHGRVHLANLKPSGPARIRVRFQQAIWDLSLCDGNAEAVLELWDLEPPAGSESAGRKSSTCLGLFVKGQVQVHIGGKEYRMPSSSRLTWTSNHPEPMGPETLPQPPDWWTSKIDPKEQRIRDTMLALIEFSDLLDKPDAVIDVVVTQVRESADAPNRVLGTLFLGALEAVPYLIDALEDRQHPEVRSTAAYVLRHWLSSGADNTAELVRFLQERRGFSPQKADIVVRLLNRYSEQELKDEHTFETLVGYPNHDNLAIRQLAFEHLLLLFPDTAAKVPYNPLADPEQRKQAMEQWSKLRPAGIRS